MGHWQKSTIGSQKFPRVTAAVSVRVTTVDPEIDLDTGRRFFRSAEESTANLSRGGAFVPSWEPLAPGRRVVLVIDLPKGEELQLVGQVVWTRREVRTGGDNELQTPGYGVEFKGGSRAELDALDRFLKSQPASSQQTPVAPSRPASPLA